MEFDEELDRFGGVTVCCTITPGREAHTPPGEYAPVDPPEPPDCDIEAVVTDDGTDVHADLTQAELDYLVERAFEQSDCVC